MAVNAPNMPPAVNLATERIRSAARHLEQDCRRILSELNANTVLFKIVAEDMEKENDSESEQRVGFADLMRELLRPVGMLRQGLLEVLECAHRLEHQCSALQDVSQNFVAGSEVADFRKLLDGATQQFLAASPFDPANHQFFDQFNQAIWNIHHPGEAAPGQEQEEIVMINSGGLKNKACPLTGKPVIDLQDPVRSTACHHIYDQAAVMDHITKMGRRPCRCAIPGCSKTLNKENFICDAALRMEIEEHRLREIAATQVAAFTDVDLEDEE